MTEQPKQQPHRTAAADLAAEARETRLAAALRVNLRRRKAQARDRDDAPPEAPVQAKKP
jgi:hypothetical protein